MFGWNQNFFATVTGPCRFESNPRALNQDGDGVSPPPRVVHWKGSAFDQLRNFSPAMPATIRPIEARRAAVAGSPNRYMPRIAVPTVPMPVQTA